MNLRHPFLIYGLCKNVRMPQEDNEAWIHPIKAIVIKKDKPGVPRSEAVYDSGHEPSDKEELTTYQTLFGMSKETSGEAGQPSTPSTTSHGARCPQSFSYPRGLGLGPHFQV